MEPMISDLSPFRCKIKIDINSGGSNLLTHNKLSLENRKKIYDIIAKVQQYAEAHPFEGKELNLKDNPSYKKLIKDIDKVVHQQFPDVKDLNINLRAVRQPLARGIHKFGESPPFTTKTEKYADGELIGDKYRYVGKKERGIEPGFKAKKQWKPADDTRLAKPSHKFYKLAHKFIKSALTDANDNPIKQQATRLFPDVDFTTLCDDEESINHLIWDKQLIDEVKEHVSDLHYIKLDFTEPANGKVSIPAHRVKGNWLRKQYRVASKTGTPRQKNISAVMEVLSMDIYSKLGFGGQKLTLIKSHYKDGQAKLMLDSLHVKGPQGEKFDTLEKQIHHGMIIDNKLMGEDGNLYPIDAKDFGSSKIITLLMADWDKIKDGTNIGYIVENGKARLMNIDPGKAQAPVGWNKPDLSNNFAKKLMQILFYGIKSRFVSMDLMKFKNLRTDFSYKKPPMRIQNLFQGHRQGMYRNISILDDTTLADKMEGVRMLRDNWNEVEMIYDEYITKFSEEGELNFKKELLQAKQRLTDRKDYILTLFEDRLKLNDEELIGLENIEKLTSKTRDHVVINKEKIPYQHLRIIPKSRLEWHMIKNTEDNTYELSLKAGSKKEARKAYETIMTHSFDFSGPTLITPTHVGNNVKFKIRQQDFDQFSSAFSESNIAKAKKHWKST